MHLKVTQAGQGVQWVRAGLRTFWRQPLALGGLFFLFIGLASVLAYIPTVGSLAALVVLPAVTLGLMNATRLAASGQFPMPSVLFAAFMQGKDKAAAMLQLGGWYTVLFLLSIAATMLADGGTFAGVYLFGNEITAEMVQDPGFQTAAWVSMLFYAPLSALFWYAPALVFWHDVSPGKSLFFSLTAFWRHKAAMLVFALTWMGVFLAASVGVTMLTLLMGGGAFGMLVAPVALLLAAMLFVSVYFTYLDAFEEAVPPPAPQQPAS